MKMVLVKISFHNFYFNKRKAGISKKSFLISLEPEAAAIYCKWIQIERDNEALDTMKPGRRFLVIDAGCIGKKSTNFIVI